MSSLPGNWSNGKSMILIGFTSGRVNTVRITRTISLMRLMSLEVILEDGGTLETQG